MGIIKGIVTAYRQGAKKISVVALQSVFE